MTGGLSPAGYQDAEHVRRCRYATSHACGEVLRCCPDDDTRFGAESITNRGLDYRLEA